MTEKPKTRSQEVAADVGALLRARNPLLWIVTREEARVEGYLAEAAAAAGYGYAAWDCAQGITNIAGAVTKSDARDPGDALTEINARAVNKTGGRSVWVMRDLGRRPQTLQSPQDAVGDSDLDHLRKNQHREHHDYQ